MRSDDRNTAARIRDAAIECFAEAGVSATSIRTIAARADVSPALVIHHYGSKEDLRVACDEHVAEIIRKLKSRAMAEGAGFNPLAAMARQSEGPPANKYLARTLVDGSDHVAELVDELVEDALTYTELGVKTGMMTPTEYPRERAAILTIWALGGLVLHEHLARLVGVDITQDFSDDPRAASRYLAPALEIAGGYITETTKEMMAAAFIEPQQEQKEET